MTSWQPDLARRKGTRYEALAEAIAEAVESGVLAEGDRLPPQRELAWKLGVTVGTVGRAYALAEQRRLVSGQVGRGTYVLAQRAAEPIAAAPATGVLDLTRNTPPMTEQSAALSEALRTLARQPGLETLLAYTPESGHRAPCSKPMAASSWRLCGGGRARGAWLSTRWARGPWLSTAPHARPVPGWCS